MSIAKEFRGKAFEQVAPRLRWRTAHGETESFRPMDELTGAVVGDPPSITFEDDAEVDIERWLAQGRITLADRGAKAQPTTDVDAHGKTAKPGGTAESGGA